MKARDNILIRLYAVLTLLCLLPVGVAMQVGWIYVSKGQDLRMRGHDQANSRVEIPAMRGTIYDRAGRALAINVARFDLALDPTIAGFEAQAATFFEKLSDLTGVSAAHYRRTIEERASLEYVLLRRSLTERQKEEIASWDVPGVILTVRFARRYSYGRAASHVLGYTSADGRGLAGLEMRYDEYLTGEPGWRAVQRDRRGRIRAYVGGRVVEPEHGQNLVLTVDLIRQTIMEEELERGIEASGARAGTAIAMNPNTGAILAMANVPDYNPNHPGRFSASARRNRAITDQYEPGSVFKLITAAAAIQQGVITMRDSVDTGVGYAVFNGDPMWDSHAIGKVTFAEVIAQSSNVGTAKVASRLRPGIFYQYARNLGFGQRTGIDLPGEVDGRLKKPSTWSGTTQTSMAIGYAVAVTPLQLLVAYSALANGGFIVKPYVVAERHSMTGELLWRNAPDTLRRAFSTETARRLLPAFERVVNEGTAERAQIEGLRIAGKTGTAKKAIPGKGYQPGRYRATFVGFYPAEDPAVVMIVTLDEPQTSIYGGAVAAPIFRRITLRWARTFPKVARHLSAPRDSLEEHRPLPMPQEEPSFPMRTVEARRPGTSPPVRLASTSRLSGTMPNLTGLSTRQAVFQLRRLGVEVRVEGHGQVARQQPAPGTPLLERAVLYCERSSKASP